MDKITKIQKNIMGTLSFDAKFNGMRKPQDFIIYPISSGQAVDNIKIQSSTRIGYISLESGTVSLCPPQSNGAYAPHLMFVKAVDKLTAEQLEELKGRLVMTADKNAGSSVVTCDNSGVKAISLI